MKHFTILYLVHTALFGLLMIIFFGVIDFTFISTNCPSDASKGTGLANLAKGLAWIYLICAGLSFIVAALSCYFSRGYLPPELGKLKKFIAITGAIERVSWILLRVLHFVLYILVLVFSIEVVSSSECVKA